MFKMGMANKSAREDISNRTAQKQVDPSELILNANQNDFHQRLQQLSMNGYNSGYLLAGTGDNVYLVAKDPEELKRVVEHWIGPSYGGSLNVDLYYRQDGNIPDEPNDTWLDALYDDVLNDASSSKPISFDQVE